MRVDDAPCRTGTDVDQDTRSVMLFEVPVMDSVDTVLLQPSV